MRWLQAIGAIIFVILGATLANTTIDNEFAKTSLLKVVGISVLVFGAMLLSKTLHNKHD